MGCVPALMVSMAKLLLNSPVGDFHGLHRPATPKGSPFAREIRVGTNSHVFDLVVYDRCMRKKVG